MKNNFNEIELPELIEVDVNPFEQQANRGSFTFKRKTILQHIVTEETPIAGYGRCRSCECKGYISKHNGSHECKNCNHHYDRHY